MAGLFVCGSFRDMFVLPKDLTSQSHGVGSQIKIKPGTKPESVTIVVRTGFIVWPQWQVLVLPTIPEKAAHGICSLISKYPRQTLNGSIVGTRSRLKR